MTVRGDRSPEAAQAPRSPGMPGWARTASSPGVIADVVPPRSARPSGLARVSLLDTGRHPPPAPTDAVVLADLNLDQAFTTIVQGREEYGLRELYGAAPTEPEDVAYRQGVFRDIERPEVRDAVETFAASFRRIRAAQERSARMHNEHQSARWFFEAANEYCQAVREFSDALERTAPPSEGLCAVQNYLREYRASGPFRHLESETRRVEDDISRVRYALQIHEGRVTVQALAGEPDLGREIEDTFRRFRDELVPEKGFRFAELPEMNHVEEEIQMRVALLYPLEFHRLREFPGRHPGFVDATLARWDRELQLFTAYLDAVARLRAKDLAFCYPEIVEDRVELLARSTFDLALALRSAGSLRPVVPNDISLAASERIVVVTGPNNGGKTTFARMFGQLHYLAALGGPVPGESVRVALCDRIFTHFERGEAVADLRGKLLDELERLRAILEHATGRSVLVLNETFASATVHDGLLLGEEILRRVIERRARCVYVTFLDELSTLGPSVISVVSTVRADDASVRTYRLIRQPADGRAYAYALAEKHGLTYAAVRAQVGA